MTAWASCPDHFDQQLATEVGPQITAAAEARHQNLHGEGVELQARTPAGEVIATGFVEIDDFADAGMACCLSPARTENWQAATVRRPDCRVPLAVCRCTLA